MKCYLVSAQIKPGEAAVAQRIAGTGALAKAERDALLAQYPDLKKKQVIIEDFEIPTAKPQLLAFINALIVMFDDTECVVPDPSKLEEEED